MRVRGLRMIGGRSVLIFLIEMDYIIVVIVIVLFLKMKFIMKNIN